MGLCALRHRQKQPDTEDAAMITPAFSVTQDSEFVHISVKIAQLRFVALALEMVVDNDLFIFSLPPYYLRLRLPGLLVDDERASAVYDLKNGHVNIKIPKETMGQDFPDLDLVAKLLARKDVAEVKKPLIEEIGESKSDEVQNEFAEAEAHDWEIRQEPENLLTGIKYGFNSAYSGIIEVSLANGNEINELSDPTRADVGQRVLERLIRENIKFDVEYYAADYIMEKHPSPDDDRMFASLLAWKSPASKLVSAWARRKEPESLVMPVEFSDDENKRMVELPRRTFLVDDAVKPQIFCAIVLLLFAYLYDLRETEGEHTIESAWTVGKLVPQLAFLDAALTNADDLVLRAAVVAGVRRALSYPLHRHWKLAMKLWDDVYYILRGGKRMVLKCLLDTRELFRFHDIYYVYDKIWLEDLCIWLLGDQVGEAHIRQLAHDLKKEYLLLLKTHVTFEKVDESEDITDDENADNIVALDLAEIEEMADESYAAQMV